jgi:hypothetical protein
MLMCTTGYKLSDVLFSSTLSPPGSAFPSAFNRVKELLKKQLSALITFAKDNSEGKGIPAVILQYKGKSMDRLREQLDMFWSGHALFIVHRPDQSPMDFWKGLEKNPQADVLAVSSWFILNSLLTYLQMLAIRIFGILPNSMPDERTGSHKT